MKLLQKFASSPGDLAKAPVSFLDKLATLLGKDSMASRERAFGHPGGPYRVIGFYTTNTLQIM